MKFDIITIFPNFFESFKNEALISRAIKKKLISINTHNLRDYAADKRGTARPTERRQSFGRVDDRPYGGGAGMVLLFEPIFRSVQKILNFKFLIFKKNKKTRIIVFSAKGKRFTQRDARRLSKLDQLIMICGRYEGIDERVARYIADEEISIGDYVLFGGEAPAMVVMEAVSRLIPGVVAKEESIRSESFSSVSKLKIKNSKLYKEHPQYTRPEVITFNKKKLRVPKILLSGDHKKIEEWRKGHSK